MAKQASFLPIVEKYVDEVLSGKKIVGREVVLACERFNRDRENPEFDFHTKEPDFVIGIIHKVFVHRQGETLDGKPLMNKPLILQPWQMFIIYNLVGFYFHGTSERRYKEAFIFVPRKNGKTAFVSALAFGLSLLDRRSGSKLYIVAASQKQALESFDDLIHTIRFRGLENPNEFKIQYNSFAHRADCSFEDADGNQEGSVSIEALASNPDLHDSFNCNLAICDEVHAFKKAAQYNRFKESQKGYTNKLIIGITTAGDNVNSYCYHRLQACLKIVEGSVKDDSQFVFISRADANEKGEVDYLNPLQHEKANPSWGVTIRPKDVMQDALQAQNEPQQRKDFFSRTLNIYTSSLQAWFDIDKVKASDAKYKWTLSELARLPIDWYGGADLSRMYDLTAACLYGQYQGVDICITHAFFPITQAAAKADEDNIPIFGWKDDGWLTMCNGMTVNIGDVVGWFVEMRKKGFKIKQVGHDRKFAGEEYFPAMRAAHFNIIDQPQYYFLKSQGFRHIEKAILDGKFYYCHSEAYEYCISNVKAIEKVDDAVQYEKIQQTQRIDLFDASVFACIRMLEQQTKAKKAAEWWGEKKNE